MFSSSDWRQSLIGYKIMKRNPRNSNAFVLVNFMAFLSSEMSTFSSCTVTLLKTFQRYTHIYCSFYKNIYRENLRLIMASDILLSRSPFSSPIHPHPFACLKVKREQIEAREFLFITDIYSVQRKISNFVCFIISKFYLIHCSMILTICDLL